MITKLKLGAFTFFVYALVSVLCLCTCTIDRFSKTGFKLNNGLLPFSTLLIPVQNKPISGFSVKPDASNFRYLPNTTRVKNPHKKRKKKNGTFEIVAFIALLACIVIGKIIFFMCWKRKRQDSIKNGDSEMGLSLRASSDNQKISLEESHCYTLNKDRIFHNTLLENYSFDELRKATAGFNASNLIEGSVYHGRLNGKEMAIKRISSDIISRIDISLFNEKTHHRHPNVIGLLGACAMDGPDSFLVLEYAKNGSLKDWIFKGLAIKSQFIYSCECFLTWDQRLKICLDVAVAMHYMHDDIEPICIHGNIRSRNIFLDDEFNAKVGNFGMASCVEHENEVDKGYLAPECIVQGASAISSAVDVFAYGVVLLEVLSGKPAMSWRGGESGEGGFISLCDEIKQILGSEDRERLREWMDSVVGEDYSVERAVMLANLAKSCVEDDPFLRPCAGEIVEKLLRLVE
ncbi:protein lyk2 [Phtheirospermum japonicum]|uniref:Protein lyk2 n=1 Tax=Phtheirospermum japonicum TaxID=374723 RepID=A0A830D870_9LAMI|nr:protein lyk2 [Phtheirospermum japonicum]